MGPRREAVVRIAALWSITKPVQGSNSRRATDQEKLPKPNLALQQLLLKLAKQEDEIDRRILRDQPSYVIYTWPSPPDHVGCIEDAAEVAGFGVKAYHKQKSARVLLFNVIIEEGLDRLGDRRLTREEQKQILAATRFPKRMAWPDWWEPDLRERGKGWRAPQVAKEGAETKKPDTVRISLWDHLVEEQRQRMLREEFDYARDYRAMSPEEQEVFAKPFERPGRPALDGTLNPMPKDPGGGGKVCQSRNPPRSKSS